MILKGVAPAKTSMSSVPWCYKENILLAAAEIFLVVDSKIAKLIVLVCVIMVVSQHVVFRRMMCVAVEALLCWYIGMSVLRPPLKARSMFSQFIIKLSW